MNFRLALSIAGLPLFLAGCDMVGPCSASETRSVVALGSLTEGTTEVASALVGVGASRGAVESLWLDWDARGPSLEGHVTSMALVRAEPPYEFLVDLPLLRQPPGYLVIGNLTQREGDSYPGLGGLFEIVNDNRALMEVRTDLPSRPLVRIPLTTAGSRGWTNGGRPCS